MEGTLTLRLNYFIAGGNETERYRKLLRKFERIARRGNQILSQGDVVFDESDMADFVRHFGRMIDTLQRAAASRHQNEARPGEDPTA